MKQETRNKIIVSALIVSIIMCTFLYFSRLRLQDQIGHTYLSKIEALCFDLKQTIEYMEKGDLDKYTVQTRLDNITLVSAVSNTNFVSIDFRRIFGDYLVYDRICSNEYPNYREEILIRLKKTLTVLNEILDDIKLYKEKHITKKLENVFLPEGRYYGKIYYDYFMQKSTNKEKYNSKFNELIHTKLEHQNIAQ